MSDDIAQSASTGRPGAWRPSARRIWLNVHLWLALAAGGVLALSGLSGALLVLKQPLLAWEVGNAAVRIAPRNAPYTSVDVWIANAQRRFPDLTSVMGVNAPRSGFLPTDAAVVFGRAAPDNGLGVVMVDPYDGQALAFFAYDRSMFASVVEFHRRLLLPMEFGTDIVAWCGVALLISLASGLYLWWPRPGRWRAGIIVSRSSRGPRRLRELHNVAAIYLFLPLLALAFSGVGLLKPTWIAVLLPVAGGRPPAAMVNRDRPVPDRCATPISPGEALALALDTLPGGRFVGLSMPRPQGPARGLYGIKLARGDDAATVTLVPLLVGRGCPDAIVLHDRAPAAPHRDWLAPLHARLMLGTAGQVLVFGAGLSLPTLFITGLMLWLTKRRNRKAAHAN